MDMQPRSLPTRRYTSTRRYVINSYIGKSAHLLWDKPRTRLRTKKYVERSLFSKIKIVPQYETVRVSWRNVQFYTFSAHSAHKIVFLNPTIFLRPTIAPHILSPFFAIFVMQEKPPCNIRSLHLSRLCYHSESSFSNSIFIIVSLDHSCTPTLPFFEDLLLFVPNSLFIAGFFDSETDFFSWHPRCCCL